MSNTGAINPMPPEWETPPLESQPWKRPGTGVPYPTGLIPSQDYTDVPRTGIASSSSGGDLTRTSGTLPTPLQINPVSVEVKVPQYQPANLVAIDNLTSTYVSPNPADSTVPNVGQIGPTVGPLQLPRGVGSRRLPNQRITPFGYTARLLVYIDSNGNGQWDSSGTPGGTTNPASGVDVNAQNVVGRTGQEAYREFEVWMGVPVDMKMAAVESVVDVGALPHGFGLQNGLLGYGATNPGFVPPPFPVPGAVSPYSNFFKPFTIQNQGNVNLYNVRAAQQTAVVNRSNNTLALQNMALLSDLVNPRFGIAALGVDPLWASTITNGISHVVTPLDREFDTAWNTALGAAGYPEFYARFAGKHTLHKAKPGAVNPTLLSLPDVPDGANLTQEQRALLAPPRVGVAVPIGTPVGTYSARLPVFEDHDTDPAVPYRPFPISNGGEILPAGPLYNGRNDQHPGQEQIRGGEGVLRPRRRIRTAGEIYEIEYQPFTEPSFVLKAAVQENALTGQTPDLAAAGTSNIVSGLLTSADPFPLVDATANDRNASALTPSAYRSAVNGSLHVYFSRNATDATAPTAAPGQPFNLFHTHLEWNTERGVWQASAPGTPIANQNANTGRWFTAPALVAPAGTNDNISNTSPFVLHDVQTGENNVVAGERATLFWLRTQGAFTNAQRSTIYYAPLNENGEPGDPTPYLGANLDASIRRYGPKAVATTSTDSPTEKDTLFVLYHGGASGRSSLYYSAADYENGEIRGSVNGRQERLLSVPSALSSASEPNGVYRVIPNPNNPSQPMPVVDVYYTGISRANQNPDIYMTRYRVAGDGDDARLNALPLARVEQERLPAPSRDPVWQSRHISWYRVLGDDRRTQTVDERLNLPEVFIQRGGVGDPLPLQQNREQPGESTTTQRTWRFDDATGLLYQAFTRPNGVTIVYVDPSAGTVRFRGPNAPAGNDVVYVSYTPQTYRITPDAAADLGSSVFFDRTTLPAITVQNNFFNTVVRRTQPMPADRQWVVWQKGAQPGRASTLYYNTRRVGIDLKAIPENQGGMRDDESLLLGPPQSDNGNNQPVAVTVTVDGGNIPFDVDFKNGRIFVPAQYEGRDISVTYTATRGSPATNRPRNEPVVRPLGWIDETAASQMIPMQRSVNEGQPLAFLDLFNGNSRLPANQQRPFDPTLQPGRVWVFWTSPRNRAYNIYWQTIAPYFESPSYSGLEAVTPSE
jgi:hypothetical protein